MYFSISVCFAQDYEFEIYPNGLMYNEQTMTQLQDIVDSLELKFRSCDLDRRYLSKLQAKGHYFKLEECTVSEVENDFENGISFEDFLKKYPRTKIDRDLLIVKFKYDYYNGEEVVEFTKMLMDGDHGYGITIYDNPKIYEKQVKNKWVFKSYDDSVLGFFFTSEFENQALPEKYARMVQYADCMIDTTANKFMEDATEGDFYMPNNYAELSINQKKQLLEEMRSTKVIGQCSQDDSPRIHAMNIAKLSAETTNWEVFLRAHLDIMNDRFERMSDGSYAWAKRKTYIKELEELDINVTDLILGIAFRIENPNQNHYYGTIWRLGRALTETKDRKEVERQLFAVMADDQLDDYNRVLGYYLYFYYSYFTEQKSLRKTRCKRLKKASKKLPAYLANQVEKIDWKEIVNQ